MLVPFLTYGYFYINWLLEAGQPHHAMVTQLQ